jgi:hypothetical protein
MTNSNPTEVMESSMPSRRGVCAMLALGSLASLDAGAAADPVVDTAIADLFALKRRAYATGDAELLRQNLSVTPGFRVVDPGAVS